MEGVRKVIIKDKKFTEESCTNSSWKINSNSDLIFWKLELLKFDDILCQSIGVLVHIYLNEKLLSSSYGMFKPSSELQIRTMQM